MLEDNDGLSLFPCAAPTSISGGGFRKWTQCQGKQRKRITAESGSEGSGEAGRFVHSAAVSVVVDPQRIPKFSS